MDQVATDVMFVVQLRIITNHNQLIDSLHCFASQFSRFIIFGLNLRDVVFSN